MPRPSFLASPRLVGLLLCGAALSLAPGARADDDAPGAPTAEERAAAEMLYEQGKALLDAGRVAEACPKLERAVTIVRRTALGGLFDLASCYEADGRNATAWSTFSEVESKARARGQEDRATAARDRKRAIEPKLHYVMARIPEATLALPGLAVSINGRPVSLALLSERFPADAGALTIRLTADGHAPSERTLTVANAPGTTEIMLDAPTPTPTTTPPPKVTPPPPPRGGRVDDGPSGATVAGIVTLSTGAVAMGIGGALFFAANGSYPSECDRDGVFLSSPPCAAQVDDAKDARSLADASGAVFWPGAGVAVIGAVLLVVSAVSGEPEGDGTTASSPLPRLAACDGAGFALCLRGSFM